MEGQKAIALRKGVTSRGLLHYIKGDHQLDLFMDFTASRDSLLKGLDGVCLLPATSELQLPPCSWLDLWARSTDGR